MSHADIIEPEQTNIMIQNWEVNLPWFGASVLRSMFGASYASLALWAGAVRVG